MCFQKKLKNVFKNICKKELYKNYLDSLNRLKLDFNLFISLTSVKTY